TILKTFGGNEATKKTKKNQSKLQYGNFKAEGSETLKQTFNILQAIVSHLEFLDVEIEQDDLNQKFLTSLPPEWLIGKGEVHTASVPTASTQVSTASTDVAAASLSHDTICAECKAPRSQDRGKRESYKQGPKVEEPAPKALMAIDGIGWDWSYMANEEENHALVADDEVPIEFALMAKLSLSSDNKVYDDSYCSKSYRKNTENLNTKISKLNEELSDCETDLYNYKRSLSQVKARLFEFKENEVKYCERIRVLERDVEIRDNKIEYLKNELEQIKKEKESLDNKLTGFKNALKDLDNLLGSQRLDKNKEGLGYSAVPPPPAQIYSPPKNDLSWTGLPEFVDDTVTDYRKDFLMQNKACFKCGYFDHLASNCGVWVDNGETWTKDNYTHKSMTPRAVLLKHGTTPMVVSRPNMNVAQPKMTSFAKTAHSNVK
nr:hypothetical protein [Tanacetum cinerariifolium]